MATAKKLTNRVLPQGRNTRRLATNTHPGMLAKQGASVPNVAAAPTQAEFNALLASLRSAGAILP